MNAIALQKIVSDAVKNSIFLNWQFYALLIGVGILSSILASYLEGWGKKKGEIAATKDDFIEIKRQLKETTEATKSVELSLSRSDWIQRESNSLKRAKLEELITSAFAVSSWSFTRFHATPGSEKAALCEAFPHFEMLLKLYFTNLFPQGKSLALAYAEAISTYASMELELAEVDARWNIALNENDAEAMERIRLEKAECYKKLSLAASEKNGAIYRSVHELGDAAQKHMEQLITTS